jgi:tripartite-type tricarboxylate transporter receptor subunit TctC
VSTYNSFLRIFIGIAALVALMARPAAENDDQFYKGKVLTMTVGVSAGGGYDQYARLLAHYLRKHIAGEPSVIVRNVPGAGSLTSVLQLNSILPTDGTQIVTFNAGLLNDSMSDGDSARVRFDDFAWLGSMARDLRVCFAWKTSGIRTWDDLLKRKDTVFGAAGANSNSANGVAVIRNLFNLKMRTIFGYPGNSEMNLAIERGEIAGTCISWTSIPKDWIKNHDIDVLVRLSPITAPGIPSSVKFVGDLVATSEQRSIVDVLDSSGELARPFIVSRKAPSARIEALRAAFAATVIDKDFLADAAKEGLMVDPVLGSQAEEIVQRLYNLPRAVAEKARAILKNQ